MLTQQPHILAPTDFSECSHHALRHAAQLAKVFNGTIHLVHVIEPIEKTDQWSYVSTAVEEIRPLVEQEVSKKLDALASEIRAEGVTVETRFLHGSGYAMLAEYANRHQIDLIVIGTTGKRGLEYMILGSTTERLLRMAHCPVMSVSLPRPTNT